MRVAYILHQSNVGSERLLVRLLSALDRDRVQPLAVLPADGPLRGELEALGVPVHILPLSWWIPSTHWDANDFVQQLEGIEGRASRLASLLATERVDLVTTFFIVSLEGALAAAQLGLPHVWHSRGFFGSGFPPPYFDDVPFLLTVVDLLADAVVCMSRGIEAQMATGCRTTRREVVYDGYDFDAFLNRRADDPTVLRQRYRIPAGARIIANVGGIQRRKGQMELVEAAGPLVTEFPDVVFAIAGAAGDIEFGARLNARIAELRLEPHFAFIGFEPQIFNVLSIAEALVHPSYSEGFGLSILEAMAMGLPVVATRCGGPEEMIEDGVSGWLVPVGDVAALRGALRAVLSDPERSRQIGRSAARSARAFSLENTARSTVGLYETVISDFDRRPTSLARRRRTSEFAVAEVLHRARQAERAARI